MDFSSTYRLELQRQLELSWEKASLIPNVFRYPLRIEKERQTSGQFKFLIQVVKTFSPDILPTHSFAFCPL